MELKNENLFQTGQIEQFSDGSEILTREQLKYVATGKEKLHIVKQGETIRGLAFLYYKNMSSEPQNWWWLIADVNRIENPLFLSEIIGLTITIPDLYQAKLSI